MKAFVVTSIGVVIGLIMAMKAPLSEGKNHLFVLNTEWIKPLSRETLEVNSFTQSSLKVSKGQKVTIDAQGRIFVGKSVRYVSPDGAKKLYFILPLSHYNLEGMRKINHAALLYKLGHAASWQLCGSHVEFIADIEDYIEFEINDNEQDNNEGAFQVTIQTQ